MRYVRIRPRVVDVIPQRNTECAFCHTRAIVEHMGLHDINIYTHTTHTATRMCIIRTFAYILVRLFSRYIQREVCNTLVLVWYMFTSSPREMTVGSGKFCACSHSAWASVRWCTVEERELFILCDVAAADGLGWTDDLFL